MTATVALVIASVALAVAGTALGLAIVVMRQSGHTASVLRRHRIAHDRAEGYADPEPETPTDHRPRGAQRYAPPTGTIPALIPDPDATAELERTTRPRPGAPRP